LHGTGLFHTSCVYLASIYLAPYCNHFQLVEGDGEIAVGRLARSVKKIFSAFFSTLFSKFDVLRTLCQGA